ncbi:MAG: hypothetical protein RR334_02155 [Clostridia bacterium]
MEEQPQIVGNAERNTLINNDASHSVIFENKDANAIIENSEKTFDDHNISSSTVKNVDASDKGSSNLGKFKDATSLYDSYIQLEAEFTRKSQKIAELTAEISSLQKKTDNQIINENNNRVDINGLDYETLINSENADKFFNEHLELNQKRDEINNIIKENIGLLKTDSPFELASLLLKGKDYKAPADLLSDNNFITEVSEDERIKDLVINTYLKTLRFKPIPKVISGEANVLSASSQRLPKSISEAGYLFEKMFK